MVNDEDHRAEFAKQRQEIQERQRQAGDRRIFQRLSALLWIDEGRTREEVAGLETRTNRGLRGCIFGWLGIGLHAGIPAVERRPQVLVQDPGADLQ